MYIYIHVRIHIYKSHVALFCGPPMDVENGDWTSDHYYYEGETSVTCHQGYEWNEMSGNLTRRCTEKGFWSSLPTCQS